MIRATRAIFANQRKLLTYPKHVQKSHLQIQKSGETNGSSDNAEKPTEKPAEFIPQLTLNPDGTATLTNADGSTQPTGAWAIFDIDNEGNTVKTVLNMNPNSPSGFIRDDNGITVNINDVCLETASDAVRQRVERMQEKIDRQIAINQWERENNFSFLLADTSTPEGKRIFNEMRMKALSEGVNPLGGFVSSLNRVEGTDWMIADGAEALIGHEILGMIENMGTIRNGRAGQINEFGFTVHIPGSFQGMNFMMPLQVQSPELILGRSECGMFYGSAVPIELWERWQSGDREGIDPHDFINLSNWSVASGSTRSNMHGSGLMDGGQIYVPEIHFFDALGLDGMSFNDRRLFLGMVQQVLDDVMPGMDARQLVFSTAFLNDDDVMNNRRSLTLTYAGGLLDEQRNTIEQALNQNRQLVDMKVRADMSGNKGLGEFTMSVLDA